MKLTVGYTKNEKLERILRGMFAIIGGIFLGMGITNQLSYILIPVSLIMFTCWGILEMRISNKSEKSIKELDNKLYWEQFDIGRSKV